MPHHARSKDSWQRHSISTANILASGTLKSIGHSNQKWEDTKRWGKESIKHEALFLFHKNKVRDRWCQCRIHRWPFQVENEPCCQQACAKGPCKSYKASHINNQAGHRQDVCNILCRPPDGDNLKVETCHSLLYQSHVQNERHQSRTWCKSGEILKFLREVVCKV